MNHQDTKNTKKKNKPKRLFRPINLLWIVCICVVMWFWIIPLTRLGFNYLKWEYRNIDEYQVELQYARNGFINDQYLFNALENERRTYFSDEDEIVDRLFVLAFRNTINLLALCDITYDKSYGYPNEFDCYSDMWVLYTTGFEIITNN